MNALSSSFTVASFRDQQTKTASFAFGELQEESDLVKSSKRKGTLVQFEPDAQIFKNLQVPFGVCRAHVEILCVSESGTDH